MIRWLRRDLRAQIGMGFGLAAVFLLILGSLALRGASELENIQNWVSKSHEVLSNLSDLRSRLEEAIDVQRYYVITGHQRFFLRFDSMASQMPGRIAALRRLTAGDAAQQKRVDHLNSLVSLRLAAAREAMFIRKKRGEEAAVSFIASGVGERFMSDIRKTSIALEMEERSLLLARSRKAREVGVATEFITALGGLAAIFLVISAVLVILHNLDRLRKIQEERDRFFNTAVDMLCIMDLNGRFQQINPSWETALRFSSDELRAEPLLDFIHPDDKTSTARALADLAAGRSLDGLENRFRRKDGSYVWLRWNAAAAEQGLVYASARDVTAQKDAERMQDEVISMVSHELRNPLTVIHSSFILLDRIGEALPGEINELLNMARTSTERMLRLIEDFLNVKKMEYGQLEFDIAPVDLNGILEETIASNRAYAESRGVRLSLAPSADKTRVKADSVRVQQVLFNLISNAIKHSPKGAVIELWSEDGEKTAKISVRDHGTGIPEDFRAQVFRKFAQHDPGRGGTGLGLSVAKSIIERLGGEISFESAGEGTTFHFTLPRV